MAVVTDLLDQNDSNRAMQAAENSGHRKIAIAIRLDPDDITALKATAARRGLTMSSVVRRALRTAGAI